MPENDKARRTKRGSPDVVKGNISIGVSIPLELTIRQTVQKSGVKNLSPILREALIIGLRKMYPEFDKAYEEMRVKYIDRDVGDLAIRTGMDEDVIRYLQERSNNGNKLSV